VIPVIRVISCKGISTSVCRSKLPVLFFSLRPTTCRIYHRNYSGNNSAEKIVSEKILGLFEYVRLGIKVYFRNMCTLYIYKTTIVLKLNLKVFSNTRKIFTLITSVIILKPFFSETIAKKGPCY